MSQILSLIIPDELYHQIENVELSGKRSLQETIIYLLKKAVDSELSPSKSINDRSKNYDFSDLVGRLEWQGELVYISFNPILQHRRQLATYCRQEQHLIEP